LIAFAIGVGATAYVLSVAVAVRAARHLADEREALLAGAMVLVSGPVVWAYLYGSDTAPFMLLFLWLFDRMLARSAAGVAVAGGLLALTRPEGLFIGAAALVFAGRIWPDDRRARRSAAV